ncbi:inner membrane protein [unidentified eubacterium SCB49]|nr:inner membrane protein [unidentified eubacterium SCB49]
MEHKNGKFSTWLKTSITARMLVVGMLILVLLIPLQFVKNLIYERGARQSEVIHEINEKWGNDVILSGPILKIPYKTFKTTRLFNEATKKYETNTETIIKTAFVFPDTLDIKADVKTKESNRSIYKSVVYTADMAVSGTFPKIDLSEQDVKPENIIWEKVSVVIQTSNIKGIKSSMAVNLDGTSLPLNPKFTKDYLNTIQSVVIPDFDTMAKKEMPFTFSAKINGSERLQFIPIGKETKVAMSSNWHSPSFNGNYSPMDEGKSISAQGFNAQWEVYQINRQFEQVFFHALPDLTNFAFGADLIIPVNEYQKSERTAKYGFLVIGLTLLVFLMIQIGSKMYIHPFQYVMIGLALVMFYTLLISISEHSSFLKAYITAASAVLLLITVYSRFMFKGWKLPALIAFSLASLYGFIYVIIQLENYALLAGSIGLFIILAIVMFASRKIDWGGNE